MPISYLSDGYRDIIGIVADIAFRMAVLNPHLGMDILCNTPGIVLIDEVDLHLHPRWQQKVLRMLEAIFPKVQVIATSHSPVILSATNEGEAFELIKERDIENEVDRIKARQIGNPKAWYFVDVLNEGFHIEHVPMDEEPETRHESLLDRLKKFSNMVKDYVTKRDEQLKAEIEKLYTELIPSLPTDTPERRAVESLRGLVK